MTTPPEQATASGRRLHIRAIAVGGAVLANIIIWLVAYALGTDFKLLGAQEKVVVINLPTVVIVTLVFSLLGWGSLALLEPFTRHAKTSWTVLAIAVLLLSLWPVFAANATTSTKIALSLLHLAVAAVLIPLLRRGPMAASTG